MRQRVLAVRPPTLRAAEELARQHDSTVADVVQDACGSLHRSIASEFTTFSWSWYPDHPDDIDPGARPAWEDGMRRLPREPGSAETVSLEVDAPTADVVTWIRQYVGWGTETVVAEAVEHARRYPGVVSRSQ